MMMIKVIFDFVLLSVANKVTFFRNVITQMTDNPNFSVPDVPLEELTLAVDAFEAAIIDARDGGHTAISIMHDLDKAVTLKYKYQAQYVDRLSNGSESLILSTGFSVSQPSTSIDKAILSVVTGPNAGSIKMLIRAIPKAGAYEWQMSPQPLPTHENVWETIGFSTQASFEHKGLTPGQFVSFRYRAITPTGVTDLCDPVTTLIN